jgi:hypothetical protein
MVTPHGSFCSSECSVLFREFKEKMKGQKKGGGALKFLLFILMLGVLAVLGLHMFRDKLPEQLQQYDILGKLLNRE